MLLTVVVAAAATNTGNNALYLVLACMLALLVVSGVGVADEPAAARGRVEPPGDLFARRPFPVALHDHQREPPLVALAAGLLGRGQGARHASFRICPPARAHAATSSFCCLAEAGIASSSRISRRSFPIGLFRKGMRSLPASSICSSSPSSSPPAVSRSSRPASPATSRRRAPAGGMSCTRCAAIAAATTHAASTGRSRHRPAR